MKSENRPKEEFEYIYKTISKVISNSKNFRRPSRSIKTSIKAINKPDKTVEQDIVTGENVARHFSFNKLADKISFEITSESETKKIADKLRQQKHRIKRKIFSNSK